MQIAGELNAYMLAKPHFITLRYYIYMDNYIDPLGMDYLFPIYTGKCIDPLGTYPVDLRISETEL